MAASPQLLSKSWEAWSNLGGSLLGALGGLFLTYDLLGGKDGPLALLTRIVTYTILFGIAYSAELGLRFGLIASLGLGLTLAVEFFYEARRVRTGRRGISSWGAIFLTLGRSSSISLGLLATIGSRPALIFLPVYALLVAGIDLSGLAPADTRRSAARPHFAVSAFAASLLFGLGAAAALWLAYRLAGLAAPSAHRFAFAPPGFGLFVALAGIFVNIFAPMIEWWTERMPKRSLAVLGIAFAIAGFLLQALPSWIILLQ